MFEVTKKQMMEVLDSLAIPKDAIILVHSSLKAPGTTEGGAEGVIEALEKTVPEGTVVFPTLSQKNWRTVFEDWHMDRPSDVGLISETFRKQPGSLRSNNATHSVAARGKDAEDIVSGPHDRGERYGIFGDYCFSHYSPWQKIYESRERYGRRAYVLFWGVSMMYNTYKHLVEYSYVEELLAMIEDEEVRQACKAELAHYPVPAGQLQVTRFWPFYDSEAFFEVLEAEGIAKRVKLGNSHIICCDIFDMVNRTAKEMRENTEYMVGTNCPTAYDWILRTKESIKTPVSK